MTNLRTAEVKNVRLGDTTEGSRKEFRWRLLVFGEQTLGTHALPKAGSVVVGRGTEAEVFLDDASVSRRHAEIEMGEQVRVRDLGSVNGVHVGGQRLTAEAWHVIQPGEPVQFGTVAAIFQRHLPSHAGRPRSLLSHGYFEMRLEEECARAGRTGIGFCVIRARSSDAVLLRETLAQLLDPAAIVGIYAPGEFEALLPETRADRAYSIAHEIEGRVRAGGATADVGASAYERDGQSPEELIAKAGAPFQGATAGRAEVVVHDRVMEQLHALAARVAGSQISILLLGETGTGKEIFAEAIHRKSPRASGPLVRLNCAALSETLLESELFGHERGAFTGAVKAKEGILESAQRGTVFLDEVGELPLGLQAKLLGVIERREVQRLGEVRPRPIDVRFVCATNRDLEAEVTRGTFRRDLFFRLNGISLLIPPLRERLDEIEPLAKAFIAHACRVNHRATEPRLAAQALELLRGYRWPGNIRELRNLIERAVVLCVGDSLGLEHFPMDRLTLPLLAPTPISPVPAAIAPSEASNRSSTDPERHRILEALQSCAGNQTEAAKVLGVSRKTLMAWMDAHRIARPRKGG